MKRFVCDVCRVETSDEDFVIECTLEIDSIGTSFDLCKYCAEELSACTIVEFARKILALSDRTIENHGSESHG